MTITTTALDVDSLLIGWLNSKFSSFQLATVGGALDTVTGVKWTDGGPIRVRDRADVPTKLKEPYGTVTFLHSYGFERPWNNRARAELEIPVTNESVNAIVGQDIYQVRFRDIKTITSFKVDGVTFATPTIKTSKGFFTPDAFQIGAAALAAIHSGSVLTISYTYRAWNFGAEIEGYEVYRLEGKAKNLTITPASPALPYEYPASRVAKMWMDQTIQFLQANMQQGINGQTSVILEEAGNDMAGAGLLPREDETECRFVVDIRLYRRSQVFTEFQLRRISTFKASWTWS